VKGFWRFFLPPKSIFLKRENTARGMSGVFGMIGGFDFFLFPSDIILAYPKKKINIYDKTVITFHKFVTVL